AAALAPRVTALAPVSKRVKILWACAKSASASVDGAVMAIVSEPPLPKIAAGATSAASETKENTSLPVVPSNQAAEAALVLPAASVTVAKKSRITLLFSWVGNDQLPLESAVVVPSLVGPSKAVTVLTAAAEPDSFQSP